MEIKTLSIEAIQKNNNRVDNTIYILFHLKEFLQNNDIYGQIKQHLKEYTETDFLVDFRKAMLPSFLTTNVPVLCGSKLKSVFNRLLFAVLKENNMNLPQYLKRRANYGTNYGTICTDSPDIYFYKAKTIHDYNKDNNTFFSGIQLKKEQPKSFINVQLKNQQYKFKLGFRKSERFISSDNLVFCCDKYNFYAVDNFGMLISEFKKARINIPKNLQDKIQYVFCGYDLKLVY